MSKGNILSPICWGLQPFRLVRLFHEDQRRLQAAMELPMDESRRDRGRIERPTAWCTMHDGQELLAQICPPIGEIGLARPALGFAVAESARRRDKIHGVWNMGEPRPTKPGYTNKKRAIFAEVR
jgi:hypothetical protein